MREKLHPKIEKERRVVFLLAMGLFIFLLSTTCLGLGIRPAKTEMESDTQKSFDGEFWVVNNDYVEGRVKISVDGEMAKYVTLQDKELFFRNDDDAKTVHFSVKFPNVVPAGISAAEIIVEGSAGGQDGMSVASKIILKHKIRIIGPYPDKYIKTNLNFQEREDGIDLITEVNNLGKEKINNVYTTYYINDKEQKTHVLTTNQKSMDTKEITLLQTKIDKDFFEQGEYEVSAVTYFDDQTMEVTKTLVMGKPEVDITRFDKFFKEHTINEYNLELLNKWNQKIENVFVDFLLKKDNIVVDTFKTNEVEIEGNQHKSLKDFFDAKNIDHGEYTAELQVNFWNTFKMKSKTYPIKILTAEEIVHISQDDTQKESRNIFTGRAIQNGEDDNSTPTFSLEWAIIVILVIIIVLLSGFILYRYKNKDKYDGGDSGAF